MANLVRLAVRRTSLPVTAGQFLVRGEERSFDGREPVARVVGEYGVGVFERL